jgi:hypothetical protein
MVQQGRQRVENDMVDKLVEDWLVIRTLLQQCSQENGLKPLELPGWVKRVNEMGPHLNTEAFHALLDHHEVTMPLGLALARGLVSSQDVEALLKSKIKPDVLKKPQVSLWGGVCGGYDPALFWKSFWQKFLSRSVDVPPLPKLKAKTVRAIDEYRFLLMYLPAWQQAERFPAFYTPPAWEALPSRELRAVEYFARPGAWLLVETNETFQWSPQRDHDTLEARHRYLAGTAMEKRLNSHWHDVMDCIAPECAKRLGLPKPAVRLPYVEELNLIGHAFAWLNRDQQFAFVSRLPTMHTRSSRQWCMNACHDRQRLVLGQSPQSHEKTTSVPPLATVQACFPHEHCGDIGFRLVALLS